jgi:pyroglutamyl-peptidase
MKQILVTGFGPFGGEPINPALEAVKKLDKRVIAGHSIVTRELPVVRQDSINAIVKYIKELDPVLVVAIGQAGGRLEITPERVAINIDDYRIADNAGNKPVDESVVARAPAAYWSTLPIKAMVKAMKDKGIPASVSNSAGTFVCNHLFYGLMHLLATEGNKRRGGFIHIPYLPEQAARLGAQPSLGLDTIVSGLEIAIQVAITNAGDVKVTGGAIS